MDWPQTLIAAWLAKKWAARSSWRAKLASRKKLYLRSSEASQNSPTYVGWIPNVAGRLSFSHIGQTRHPAPCRTLNEDDGHQRLIICAQDRPLSDALVNGRYFKFVYGYDPSWTFVLIANSEARGADKRAKLVGQIYVFNRTRWLEAVGGNLSGEDLIGDALEAASVVTEQPGGCAVLISGALKDIAVQLSASAVYVVGCEIGRNGIVKVTETARASGVLFTPAVTEAARPIDSQAQRYFCNQAYFFLKDISHSHRHHHKKADTITAAYPDDAEQSWIRETQYGIHRRVVKVRRSKEPQRLYDALGLMAYMKSFKAIIAELPTSPGKHFTEQYNLDETEESIKATAEVRKWGRVQMNLILTAIPTLIFGLTTILRPPAHLSNQAGSIFETLRECLAVIYSNDIRGTLAALLTAAVVPFVYGAVDITRLEPVQTAKRMITVWPAKRQATVWTLCAACTLIVNLAGVFGVFAGWVSRDAFWYCSVASIGFSAIFFFALPYLFTVPDLFRLLRTYPHRPDLSKR